MAFIAQSRPNRSPHPKQIPPQGNFPYHSNVNQSPNPLRAFPKPTFNCNNCRKAGHSSARCYAVGGGLEGQAPGMKGNGQITTSFMRPPNAFSSQVIQQHDASAQPGPEITARLADQQPSNAIIMASIKDTTMDPSSKIQWLKKLVQCFLISI